MNEQDNAMLENLKKYAFEAADKLKDEGFFDLANNLLLTVGYAIGMSYRPDIRRYRLADIAASLAPPEGTNE